MTPDGMLEGIKQLVMAVVAFAMSLGGAAGVLPPRSQVEAVVNEVLSVPRLPSDDMLAVDEVDEVEDDLDEDEDGEDAEDEDEDEDEDDEDDEDDLEEVDADDLDESVEARFIVLRGPISQRPAGGVVGTWVIAGREVQVTAATVVSMRAARSSVGDWAQVKAEGQAAVEEADDEDADDEEVETEQGALIASSLSVMSSTNKGRVVGIIESIGEKNEAGESKWVVSGVGVTVVGSTNIVGTPQVGRLADVHGAMSVETPAADEEDEEPTAGANDNDNEDADDDEADDEVAAVRFVAKLVVVRGTPNLPKEERQREKEQKQKRATFKLNGVIESKGDGTWVISGQTIEVGAATRIDQKKGQAEVGAQVRALIEQDESGSLVALEIEVQKAKGGKKAGPVAKPTKEKPNKGKK